MGPENVIPVKWFIIFVVRHVVNTGIVLIVPFTAKLDIIWWNNFEYFRLL